jgi:hypothetical protein
MLYHLVGYSQWVYRSSQLSRLSLGHKVLPWPSRSAILPRCHLLLVMLVHKKGAGHQNGASGLRYSTVQCFCWLDLSWYLGGYGRSGTSACLEMAFHS